MHGKSGSLFATLGQSARLQPLATGRPTVGKRMYRTRNLLRTPDQAEQFSARGLVEKALDDDPAGLRKLMRNLSSRVAREHWTTPLPEALEPAENPHIPAGYTYLLQLIAHDLVHSSVSLAGSATGAIGVANTRLFPLSLETIYGGGPDVCPAPYEIDGAYRDHVGVIPRTRFRVGQTRTMDGKFHIRKQDGSIEACPFRDIARAIPAGVRDSGLTANEQLSKTSCHPLRTEALLADNRNDDHALISQMAGLWQTLHNQVIDMIPIDGLLATLPPAEQAYRRFFCARFVVTLIYRAIVVKDVLPLILHPEVLKLYTGPNPPQLDAKYPGSQDGMPVEFLAGAFRFGHAMVRDAYRVNASEPRETDFALRQSSLRSPSDLPLNENWVVDWSRFFNISERAPNFSHRIGPTYAGALNATHRFPPISQTDMAGLADRDFVTAAYAGLWSVPALCKEMRAQGLSSVLADYDAWKPKLRAWLSLPPASGYEQYPLSPTDIDILVDDPPLPFFVLFEAGQPIARAAAPTDVAAGESLHLGSLGSIIVAETIFGALARTPIAFEDAGSHLKDQIAAAANDLLGDADCLDGIPEIATMSDLLLFMIKGGVIPPPRPGA